MPPQSSLTRLAREFPILTFYLLACAFTWSLLPFAGASLAFSLLALFGPAIAALGVVALQGTDARRALRARMVRWRVPLRLYLAALLAPLAISAAASSLELLWGASGPIRLQPLSPLDAVVFVLVVGEEVGWRGFALPLLLTRFGPWSASIRLGLLWALWHLPLFYIAGMPQFGNSFPAYATYTVALSLLMTMLAQRTAGSVVLATLFHGAVNAIRLVNQAADAGQRAWGDAVAYGVIAVLLGAVAWRRRT